MLIMPQQEAVLDSRGLPPLMAPLLSVAPLGVLAQDGVHGALLSVAMVLGAVEGPADTDTIVIPVMVARRHTKKQPRAANPTALIQKSPQAQWRILLM